MNRSIYKNKYDAVLISICNDVIGLFFVISCILFLTFSE